MARLVNTVINQKLICNVTTSFEDGTVSVKPISVGDVVEGLRYVDGGEVKTVSGLVKDIKFQVLRLPVVKATTNPVDTFAKDVKILKIVIDASEQYSSNVVTVDAHEIVEDEGVTNVTSVHCLASLNVFIDQTYTDNSERHLDLVAGDILDDVVVMNSVRGKEDITGKFTLCYFLYTLVAGKISVHSLVLKGEDNKVIVAPFTRLLSAGTEIEQVSIKSEEALVEAFGKSGTQIINFDSDVTLSAPLNTAEDSIITLNMNGHELVVPEAVNGRSIYAINNYGVMTIDDLTVSARGIQNYGTMIINDCNITARDTNGGAALWTYPGSETVINGGNFNVTYVGSTSESTGPGCLHSDGSVTINGGTFESPNKRCYAIISNGTGIVNDASVHGAHGGYASDAGISVINGGTFKSDEYYGVYLSCDSYRANDDEYDDDEMTVCTIRGGDFTGRIISVWIGSDPHDDVNASCIIEGGRFHNPLNVQNNVIESAGIWIRGGKFVKPVQETYIEEGYYAADVEGEEGWYTVLKA